MEAIASRLEAISIRFPPQLGWRPLPVVTRASLLVARTLLVARALLLVARSCLEAIASCSKELPQEYAKSFAGQVAVLGESWHSAISQLKRTQTETVEMSCSKKFFFLLLVAMPGAPSPSKATRSKLAYVKLAAKSSIFFPLATRNFTPDLCPCENMSHSFSKMLNVLWVNILQVVTSASLVVTSALLVVPMFAIRIKLKLI